MPHFHSFKFKTDFTGQVTRVFMDDQELHGVTGATVFYQVNNIPEVTLTFASNGIEIESENTIVVNSEGKQ